MQNIVAIINKVIGYKIMHCFSSLWDSICVSNRSQVCSGSQCIVSTLSVTGWFTSTSWTLISWRKCCYPGNTCNDAVDQLLPFPNHQLSRTINLLVDCYKQSLPWWWSSHLPIPSSTAWSFGWPPCSPSWTIVFITRFVTRGKVTVCKHLVNAPVSDRLFRAGNMQLHAYFGWQSANPHLHVIVVFFSVFFPFVPCWWWPSCPWHDLMLSASQR